ncbi:MAG: hypothetical protein IKY23_06240 [Lachnospiraceae bacterium]|nr:hypothetical protein [Lachnospiraceae bacterium]
MYKRGLALLLAAVLGLTPAMQVHAAETTSSMKMTEETAVSEVFREESVSAEETPEGIQGEESVTTQTPEEAQTPEATQAPEETQNPEETPGETPVETPVASTAPEETAVPEEIPEESASPEESMSPEESAAPEETLSPEESATPEETLSPEESATPEESLSPEESATPEEMPEESASPEASETPAAEGEERVDAELVNAKYLTEDIDLRSVTTDTSGTGWTWKASTKTFTMNGYYSKGQLSLPKDATVVFAKGSDNQIDVTEYEWYDRKDGIYCVGNLTVKGSGKLTINYTRGQAIDVGNYQLTILETNIHFINKDPLGSSAFPQSTHIIATNMTIEHADDSYTFLYRNYGSVEGCEVTYGKEGIKYEFDDIQNIYGELNEETGLYQVTLKSNPAYVIMKSPRISEIHIGDTVTLQVTGNALNGKEAKYQWYKALSYTRPWEKAVKVAGATGKTLTVTAKEYGVEYYFCQISAGNYHDASDTCALAIGHKGAKICTEPLTFSATESVDRLAADGFKWDHTTRTATFSNMDYLYPYFGSNTTRYLNVPSGATLKFEGNNYALDNQLRFTKANQSGLITTLTGPGTFSIDQTYEYVAEGAEIHLTGGLTLSVHTYSAAGGDVSLLMNNATLKTASEAYVDSDLIMKNASRIEAAGKMEIGESLTIGEGCQLITEGKVTIGGNLEIGTDALFSTASVVRMQANSDYNDRTCVINGTLHIQERTTPEILFQLYSTRENPVVLGEGVSVITPKGAEVGPIFDGDIKLTGLLIGKGALTTQKISGGKTISGTPKYGHLLTAGEISPAGALVSYQWQYAETPDGPWNNISKAKAKTYFVESKYHGYYLRVVMKGFGDYTGTIGSTPVGPVVGDPATLKALYGEGSEESEVLIQQFDGHTLSYGPTTTAKEDGTYRYIMVPVNENAKIKLYNDTTGFEGEGEVIDVPMADGENIVRILVTYGGRTVTYKLEHTIKPAKYYLSMNVYGNTFNKLTASFVDETGVSRTVSTGAGQTSSKYAVSRGTKVTFTSQTEFGKCAYRYGEIEEVADYTKDGSPLTVEWTRTMEVEFGGDNHIGAKQPRGLTADWLLNQEKMRIKVDGRPVEGVSTRYNVTVEIYDEAENPVSTISVPASTAVDANGLYLVDTGILDSSKNYVIKAYFTGLFNKYADEEILDLQKAKFTLEKRREISLSAASEYIVLKPGETAQVPVNYNGYTGSKVSVDYFDTQVVDAANTFITEDANGNKTLQIRAAGEGSTYVTLRGDNYVGAGGEQYVYAHVRVEVSSVDEAEKLRLGTKKGTINLYDDKAITVPVYQMECGHEIESAEFVKASLNKKFTIQVVNDRTLKIIPKVPENDGTVDYAKWIKKKGTTGTFTSKIKVNYNGASSRESKETFTVTLKAKAPEIKASKLSLSSFYTTQTKKLNVSVKGEKIAKLEVDTVKSTAAKPASPVWLSLTDEKGTVAFDGKAFPGKKAETYLYLQVWPEGYFVPLQTKVKVSVAYTMPKIVPDQNPYKVSGTFVKGGVQNSITFRLNSGNSKVSYKDLGVEGIRLMSEKDFALLSKTERERLKLSKNLKQGEVGVTTGRISVSNKYSTPIENGTVRCYVAVKNGKDEVPVDIPVKCINSAVKLNKSKLVMDAMYGGAYWTDEQKIKVSTNLSNYQPIAENFTYQITMEGDKKKTDCSSHFTFLFWNSDSQEISIRRNENTVAGKTYKVKVTHPNLATAATFTIQVKKSANPVLQIAKKNVTLNRIASNNGGAKSLQMSLSKKMPSSNWKVNKATIWSSDVGDETGCLNVRFDTTTKILKIATTDITQKGTYKIKLEGVYNDTVKLDAVTITVKVTDKVPNIKPAKTTYTLNKNLAENDKAIITLPVGDYKYASAERWSLKSVKTEAGKNATDKLDVTLSGNQLTVATNEKSAYGATYQVVCTSKFAYNLKKNVTYTVKIAGKKAAVSVTGKAKSAIQLARPGSTYTEIVYTYKNWNETTYPVNGNTPILEWAVFAKNGKKALTAEEGAIGVNGMVAMGSSADGSLTAGSWFKNIGYQTTAPYKIKLAINDSSAAFANSLIGPHYTYTVKAQLIFPSKMQVIDATDVTFAVKPGTGKYALEKNAVTLRKLDDRGRALITIKDKNKAGAGVREIAYVEVAGNKKVPVSNAVELVPIYRSKDSVTYALYWKNRKSANVESGSVKLNIYLKGNNNAWKKPNSTVSLKVNVK